MRERPQPQSGTRAPAELDLSTPLADIRGVTARDAQGVARLEMKTVSDLVKYLPMRYERIEAQTTIDRLQEGTIVSAVGVVAATKISGPRYPSKSAKTRFMAVLTDHTGRLDLVWFNQPYLRDKLLPGMMLRVQGQARRFGPGLQIVNPKHSIIRPEDESNSPAAAQARIRPIYQASEQLSSERIERLVDLVLQPALSLIEDHLSQDFRDAKAMPSLAQAYRMAHQPRTLEETVEARRRLAYDELLMLQLGVFMRRAQIRRACVAPALKCTPAIDQHIRARFPFTLTPWQNEVIRDIASDLAKPEPASRLLQGDVGSGKTIVALYAMLLAVACKKQAAIMAPTEILAEQHFYSISQMLEGSSVRIGLLTGSLSEKDRQAVLAAAGSGDIDILVGTHALLGERVDFADLAVAIIDEQHRFGVHQRAALRGKGGTDERGRAIIPHTLVMTATPIPRTLALTLLGDLDISTIEGLPPGRTPIVTKLVPPASSGDVYAWLRSRLDAGEQAYVVVPAIDTGASSIGAGGDAELNDLRTVVARLEAHELTGKRIAAIHGRLLPRTRDMVMGRFRTGLIDCLVATTVIEVGVDVPNATIMVIEHAEQFGLAQLHQLRGRVGRGSKRSVCVLIGDPATPDAQARLNIMTQTADGFVIAEKDLEIRGPGEVFGLRQAGAPPMLVADLLRDRELLAMARRDAAAWIERSPELQQPSEALLRKRLMKIHGKWLGLADVG